MACVTWGGDSGEERSARSAVLVDQHPLWLEAVEQVLTGISIRVVGKATSFDEGSRLIADLEPELVVAEISNADAGVEGLAWLTDLRQRHPEVKVVVLSAADDPATINAVLSAGVAAFVVKKAHPDDLAVAVRQAYEHSIYLPSSSHDSPGLAPMSLTSIELTRRELEILLLVAEGHSNSELARMLWVTEQTVKFHLSNIYRKLDVSNRTEASRWAQVHGLLSAQQARSTAA